MAGHSLSLKEVHDENQAGTEAETMDECCLLAQSLAHCQLAFF